MHIHLLRAACILTLSGYALIHFTWDGRLISQIYSEGVVRFFASLFGIPWRGFFTEGAVNPSYRLFILSCGGLFAIGAFCACLPIPVRHPAARGLYRILFWTLALLILFAAFSEIIDSKLHWNILIEYSIKLAACLVFLQTALGTVFSSNRHIRLIKVVTALTFIGHGVYALNIFPIPDNFLMMTSNILKTGRDGSIVFLAVAGAMDILVSIMVFTPKYQRSALLYMAVWGFLTALARPVAFWGTAPPDTYLAMWLPAFLVRSGHFLLPLYLLAYIRRSNEIPDGPAGA